MGDLPRMRPRFELRFAGSVEALRDALRADLEGTSVCEGKVFRSNAALWLPEDKRSYWSPYLNLSFETDEEEPSATVLYGRFSPHPKVWTLFMAIYFVFALVGMGMGIYGMVEWSLHQSAWWLLGIPGAVAAIAFVFGASLIGQGLSADEMHVLRHVVEHACGLSHRIAPGAPLSVPPR